MYTEEFWEHVRHPRNQYADPQARPGEAQYKRCGDKLKIFIKVDGGIIASASFQAKACAPVVAVASLGTQSIIGLDVESAKKLDIFEMDQKLGGLPQSKRHAYLLLLQCLNQALG